MTYEKKLIDDVFSIWFNLTKDNLDIQIEIKEANKMKAQSNKRIINKWILERNIALGLVECSCGCWLKTITGSHLKTKKHLGN